MQRHGTGQSLKLVPGDVLFIPEGTPEVLILCAAGQDLETIGLMLKPGS